MPGSVPASGDAQVLVDGHALALTNLDKVYWPKAGRTKGDLIAYYAAVADVMVPHLEGRGCVLRRFPDGVEGEAFYVQRKPRHAPDWVRTCAVPRSSGKVLDQVDIADRATLMWVAQLGAIDVHPQYARADRPGEPDVMHFDLDPTPGTAFAKVCEAALAVKEALDVLGLPSVVKTSGNEGLHVYIPIVRGPSQKDVWRVARDIARVLGKRNPSLFTLTYRVASRPKNRVLLDFNQNAEGRTLAAPYAARPTARASVSAPLRWSEVEAGVRAEWFRLDTMPARVAEVGDLWAPVTAPKGRADVAPLVAEADPSAWAATWRRDELSP
jgi:bifunctional non-homologous end joining protein LigD